MSYSVSVLLGSKKYQLITKTIVSQPYSVSFFVEKDELTDGHFQLTNEVTQRTEEVKFKKLHEVAYLPFYQVLTLGDWVFSVNHEGQMLHDKPHIISAISEDRKYIQIEALGQSFMPAEQIILANYYQYNALKHIIRLNVLLKTTESNLLYFELKDSNNNKICYGLFT